MHTITLQEKTLSEEWCATDLTHYKGIKD